MVAKAKLGGVLFLGVVAGLTGTLGACKPAGDTQAESSSLLSEAPLGPGWSMNDLAGVDPALLTGSPSELPRALPMQTSWDGGYDYAPTYDYAPDTDGYYEPLDESYYAESSGSNDYVWLALAAGLAGMLGDSPPDYAFGYSGVQPWAWETGDRYVRYAEPVRGGYRYYYYEPNTDRPFLVRDPYYSYGYRDDRLMAIYDRHGRIVDGRHARYQRLAAREYYSRGEHLYRAGHKHRRFGVPARLWDGHRDEIGHERHEWEKARRDRGNWQRWDARHHQRLRRNWASEALVRRKAERDFARWQKADYRTPAPKFYTDESRRKQLRRVAAVRREQANQRHENWSALVQHRDRARDHAEDRRRKQHDRVARGGDSQTQARVQRTSLVAEQDKRRADRVERTQNRRTELRRESTRPRRAERRPPASVEKKRVTGPRTQARQVEQRRKAQQADRQRQTARNAETRRDRTRQSARTEARRQEQAKRKSARQARQERAGKAQAQAQARKKRQTRQPTARTQSQRAERQAQKRQQARQAVRQRQQANRQQEQRRTERQTQRQRVRKTDARSQQRSRQADARSQQRAHRSARQTSQPARPERRRNTDR